jgi:uncharacterized membrane protein
VSHLTAFVYVVGAIVCHQIPERSFHFSGIQFPVCARCTGLYVGGAAGLVLWLLRRNRTLRFDGARTALLVSAVPTVVTLATAAVGWWDPVNALRALAAAPLGVAAGAVVAAGVTGNLR